MADNQDNGKIEAKESTKTTRVSKDPTPVLHGGGVRC